MRRAAEVQSKIEEGQLAAEEEEANRNGQAQGQAKQKQAQEAQQQAEPPMSPNSLMRSQSIPLAPSLPSPPPTAAAPSKAEGRVDQSLLHALERVSLSSPGARSDNDAEADEEEASIGLDPALVNDARTKLERTVVDLLHVLYSASPPLSLPASLLSTAASHRFPLSASDPPLQSYALGDVFEGAKRMGTPHVSNWVWREYVCAAGGEKTGSGGSMIERSEKYMERLVDAWAAYKRSAHESSPSLPPPPMPRYFETTPDFFPLVRSPVCTNLLRQFGSVDFASSREILAYMRRTERFVERLKRKMEQVEKQYPSTSNNSKEVNEGEEKEREKGGDAGSVFPPFFRFLLSPADSFHTPSHRSCRSMLQACAAVQPKPRTDVAEQTLREYLQYEKERKKKEREIAAAKGEMETGAAATNEAEEDAPIGDFLNDDSDIPSEYESLYLALMSSYARTGDFHRCLHLLSRIPSPTVYAVTCALSSCSFHAEGARAGLELFEEVESRFQMQEEVDSASKEREGGGGSKSKRSREQQRRKRRLQQRGGEFEDDALLDESMDASTAAAVYAEALRVQWARFEPDLVYYETALRLYELSGQFNEALSLFEVLSTGRAGAGQSNGSGSGGEVVPVQVRPRPSTFAAMIHCCGRAVQAIQRRSRERSGFELGEPRDLVLVNDGNELAEDLLMAAMGVEMEAAANGDEDALLQAAESALFFDELSSFTPPSVYSYSVPQLLDMARSFLLLMQRSPFHLRPSETVYKNLLGVMAHAYAPLEQAKQLWADMMRDGVQPRAITWTAMLFALVKCGGTDAIVDVIQWHERMAIEQRRRVGVDNVSVQVLLHALARNLRLEASIVSLTPGAKDLQRKKVARLVGTALRHFGWLSEFRVTPSRRTVAALLKCLALANRSGQVERVLQIMGKSEQQEMVQEGAGALSANKQLRVKPFEAHVERLLRAARTPDIKLHNMLLMAHILHTVPSDAQIFSEPSSSSLLEGATKESPSRTSLIWSSWTELLSHAPTVQPNIESHVLLLRALLACNSELVHIKKAYALFRTKLRGVVEGQEDNETEMEEADAMVEERSPPATTVDEDEDPSSIAEDELTLAHVVSLLRVACTLPPRSASTSPLLFLWIRLQSRDAPLLISRLPLKVLEEVWMTLAQQLGSDDQRVRHIERRVQEKRATVEI